MTEAEQKAYSKGYSAGRKRGQADKVKMQAENRRDEIQRQAYLAIAPAIIQSNWNRGEGKATVDSKMLCIDSFVEALMKRI